MVGELLGAGVGERVGAAVGERVGDEDGAGVGDTVGVAVGEEEGKAVGDIVGARVGEAEGAPVGMPGAASETTLVTFKSPSRRASVWSACSNRRDKLLGKDFCFALCSTLAAAARVAVSIVKTRVIVPYALDTASDTASWL